MVKRGIVAFVGLMLTASIVNAAPLVMVDKDQVVGDTSYTFSSNTETYNTASGTAARDIKGHSEQYGFTFGIGNNYAVNIGYGLIRPNTFTDSNNYRTTPKLDTVDIQVQKKLNGNVAGFVGMKHIGGTWTFEDPGTSYISSADNNGKNKLELGLITNIKLDDRLSTFAKVGIMGDDVEGNIGFGYKMGQAQFEVGYTYQKFTNLWNPLFPGANPRINNLDIESKGLYLGLNYSF